MSTVSNGSSSMLLSSKEHGKLSLVVEAGAIEVSGEMWNDADSQISPGSPQICPASPVLLRWKGCATQLRFVPNLLGALGRIPV
jgi:hypothetical protein